MPGALTELKAAFVGETCRAGLNARLTARGLPALGGPIARSRPSLRLATSYPALGVELGEVTASRQGAGGLTALTGRVTCWLAVAAGEPTVLLEQLGELIDCLRQTVECDLAGAFQRLEFAGADVEGEPLQETPAPVRLIPVRFRFVWLYVAGS